MPGDTPRAEGLPSYAEALAELDAILDDLEAGDADIDALAARVERAATLVRLCRDKLDEARTKVTRIVADLDAEPGNEPAGAPSGGEPSGGEPFGGEPDGDGTTAP